MIPEFVEKLLLVLLGFLLSETHHWLGRRRDRVKDAAVRYLSLIEEGCWTGLALQRCGAAGLKGSRIPSWCQFRSFCLRVVSLGGTDPLRDLDLRGLVCVRKMPALLREASQRGVLLACDKDLYHFLVALFLERKN